MYETKCHKSTRMFLLISFTMKYGRFYRDLDSKNMWEGGSTFEVTFTLYIYNYVTSLKRILDVDECGCEEYDVYICKICERYFFFIHKLIRKG